MSWWDYGYQISGMANRLVFSFYYPKVQFLTFLWSLFFENNKRTTLVDNNTWNNSHIAMVGKAMASNEDDAYTIMQELGVDYVLVIFGGLLGNFDDCTGPGRHRTTVPWRLDYNMICSGYSGDDINKFLWMVRIAEGEHPNEVKEANFMSKHGHYTVDHDVSKTMKNSLMYKLSYYK